MNEKVIEAIQILRGNFISILTAFDEWGTCVTSVSTESNVLNLRLPPSPFRTAPAHGAAEKQSSC